MAQCPIGSIVAYFGDLGAIPSGWELYDLADRCVLGAGGLSAVSDLGGSLTQTFAAHAHGKNDLFNYIITFLPSGGHALNAHGHTYAYTFASSGDVAVDLSNGVTVHAFTSGGGHTGSDDTTATSGELEWLDNANYHTHPVNGDTDASTDIPSAYVQPMTGVYSIIRVS